MLHTTRQAAGLRHIARRYKSGDRSTLSRAFFLSPTPSISSQSTVLHPPTSTISKTHRPFMTARLTAMAEQLPKELPQQQPSVTAPAEPTITPTQPKSVALIICSTRPGRINPAITRYIESLIRPSLPSSLTLSTIDLKTWDLPMFNESTIPAALPKDSPTGHYATAHAKAWSTEISKHSAFIFVTPQYNWSMPASIKNAIDYLYHEWTGKAGVVISYGGHGGGKSRTALEDVLKSVKISVAEGAEITVNPREAFVFGEKDGEGPKEVTEAVKGKWIEAGVDSQVEKLWEEFVKALE